MKFTIVSGLFAALPAFVTAAPAAPETGLLDRRVTTNDNVFLYPGGLGDPLNGVLGSYPASTLNYLNVDKYQQNKIPLRCKEKAQALYNGSPRCPLSDMYVFDFSWEDAPGRTWTICYCKNSPVALGVSNMIDNLSSENTLIHDDAGYRILPTSSDVSRSL